VTATTLPPAAPAPAPSPLRAPRHLEVVPPGARSPRAQRRRARLLAAAATGLLLTVLFGLVAFHVVLTQGQLQLDQLQSRAADEQARYDRLRLQVAELEAPERVVAEAQQRLGMVPPPGVTYLSPTGVATSTAPPAAGRAGTGRATADQPATSWPVVKAHLAGQP
jgi:cell division protein FtsL